jgi:hypothetical protein
MSDLYGIVICPSCQRKRIADLRCEMSACPYCGAASRTDRMTILFSDRRQSTVRDVLSSADSAKYPEPRKKSGNDPDPLSTLIYEYEHASGTAEGLMVLAKGLTDIKGSFTEKDVEELFPGKGERMIRQMVLGDIVIELHYNEYKAL